eukprot:TRINITY_DN48919_c0_g1_i1.p1 TRINITY_DN48919_c0_g1~~TRINITY_DN48919_c0_g1_i1.p1  ORF type:complete len:280 (+),score=20.83 TRINITY_DN48919_c0_g1_i1:58-840(+)
MYGECIAEALQCLRTDPAFAGFSPTPQWAALLTRYATNALLKDKTQIPLTNPNSQLLYTIGSKLFESSGLLHRGGSLFFTGQSAVVLSALGRVCLAVKRVEFSVVAVPGEPRWGCPEVAEVLKNQEPDLVVFLNTNLDVTLGLSRDLNATRYCSRGLYNYGHCILVSTSAFPAPTELLNESADGLCLGISPSLSVPLICATGTPLPPYALPANTLRVLPDKVVPPPTAVLTGTHHFTLPTNDPQGVIPCTKSVFQTVGLF